MVKEVNESERHPDSSSFLGFHEDLHMFVIEYCILLTPTALKYFKIEELSFPSKSFIIIIIN